MLTLNLKLKIRENKMDVQIIQKFLQQKKLESVRLVDIQCQKFRNLITKKTNIIYIMEKTV